jgi:hypothetical protein
MRGLRFDDIPTPTTSLQHTTLTTLRVGSAFDTGSEMNFISPSITQKPGIATPQMRFELTENLALAKFGEWTRLESELLYWISEMPKSGKSHLGRIVLNGPWSNKEPTSRLSAQGVRCNHCFTKDLQDLLKPDRKPFQSMRGDDSVSAVSMEIPHVHLKTTDNREQTDPDIAQINPSRTQSKACARIGSYTSNRSGGEEMEKSQSNESSSSSSRIKQNLQAQNNPVPLKPKHMDEPPLMTREQSSRIEISRPTYQRPKHDRVFCTKCSDYPEGFRGEHELRRHQDRSHKPIVKKWFVVEEWRDNISERIPKRSRLVKDEKVRNSSTLSRTLAYLSAPTTRASLPQATSSLAGLGAPRATAGNITTGIPVEEKYHGPNKGDILNGAVIWTRDLTWILHLKPQQQEDLIAGLGGTFPFEESEDERRMYTALMDAMAERDGSAFHSKVFSQILRSVYAGSGRFSPFPVPAWLTECGGASIYSPDGNSYEFDVDSGHETFKSSGGSLSELSTIRANKEFENRLDEALSRTMGDNSGSKTKTASTRSTMLYKLLKRDTEIIEAASDGDIARVAKLISRGANVNIRDRWGVSCLFCRLCYLS